MSRELMVALKWTLSCIRQVAILQPLYYDDIGNRQYCSQVRLFYVHIKQHIYCWQKLWNQSKIREVTAVAKRVQFSPKDSILWDVKCCDEWIVRRCTAMSDNWPRYCSVLFCCTACCGCHSDGRRWLLCGRCCHQPVCGARRTGTPVFGYGAVRSACWQSGQCRCHRHFTAWMFVETRPGSCEFTFNVFSCIPVHTCTFLDNWCV